MYIDLNSFIFSIKEDLKILIRTKAFFHLSGLSVTLYKKHIIFDIMLQVNAQSKLKL